MKSRFVRSTLFIVPIALLMSCITAIVHSENNADHFQYLPSIQIGPPPYPVWATTYGGNESDSANVVVNTADGGFAIAGSSWSSRHPGLLLKLDKDGKIQWQKVHQFGGPLTHVQEAADGSLLAASVNNYNESIIVVKHRADGSEQWKTFFNPERIDPFSGGELDEVNGGAILAGHSSYKSWLWRIDSKGSPIWKKKIEPVGSFQLETIQHTTDGGFITAGQTTAFGATNTDGVVLKLDKDGDIVWQYRYDGTHSESITSIRQTRDGGYIAVGHTYVRDSEDGQPALVIKLRADGSVSWAKHIEISENAELYTVREVSNGNYVAAGQAHFNEPHDVKGWAIQLNSSGEIMWQRLYEFPGQHISSIDDARVGGLVMTIPSHDVLVVRTDQVGSIPGCEHIRKAGGTIADYPITSEKAAASPITLEPGTGPHPPHSTYIDDGSVVRLPICPSVTTVAACKIP